ncbi:MAG: hypothetical protein GC181_01675 [Bacteroidetes bacterium]|nr:hypothetical protein [Bacteroidota bacterium]
MTRYLLLVLTTGFFLTTKAQVKEWTLSECVEYALQNNLSLKDQNLSMQRSELYVHRYKMDQLPTLNSSASLNYNFGRTIDPFTNQYVNQTIQSNSFSLSSNLILYNGFRIRNTILRSQNQMVESEFQTEVIRNNVSLGVVEAYLQVVYAMKQLEIVKEQAASTSAQMERAKQLFEAGKSTQSEYLNLKAQVSRDKYNVQQAEGTIRLNYLSLQQWMQIPQNDSFKIALPDLTPIQPKPLSTLDEIIKTGMETIPDIKLAETQLATSIISTDIAESGIYPRLSFFGNVNTLFSESRLTKYNPQTTIVPIGYVSGTNESVLTQYTSYDTKTTAFGKQLHDNFGQAVGFTLSIPIFNNHQVKTNIADAKLNEEASQNNLERTKNQIQSDIVRSYTEFENAQASYLAAVEDENAQSENYEFALKRFEAGLITSLELLIAKTNWVNSQTTLARARFELIFTNTQVLLYQTGKVQLPVR